jgi:hypothetical protein
MRMGGMSKANPLVQADRHQAWLLALNSIDHLDDPLNANARINMCAASFLHNRDVDHGGLPFEVHWVMRVCYALGAGLMSVNDRIDPGEAYLSLTASAIRIFGDRDLNSLREMCSYLPLVEQELSQNLGVKEIADLVESFFASRGFHTNLADKGVTPDQIPRVREVALRNFNADRKGQFAQEVDNLDQVLKFSLLSKVERHQAIINFFS